MNNDTILTVKHFDFEMSIKSEKEMLSQDDILELFRSLFFGMGFGYEQWESALINQIENL
jgi:hypothetical protein